MAEQDTQEKQISIQKIYMKDFSFESPRSPEVFTTGEWNPKTNLNLRSSHVPLGNDIHEVILTITVETKHDDKTLFLIELHQAGLFHISGYESQALEAIVGSFCPGSLYPYARESIASVVAKGGFPEFVLQPINFDVLFAEGKKQAMAKAAQAASPVSGSDGEGTSH